MNNQKTNHRCKYSKCAKGIDGERALYWACNDCDERHNWRAIACSPECWQNYMDEIECSRAENCLAQVEFNELMLPEVMNTDDETEEEL